MVRVGDLRGNKQPQDPTKICANICLMQPRQLRGIFFIDPDDEEFKHTVKNARRTLEIPMPAAMSCKTPVNETCRNIGKTKPNILVLSMRRIYENTIRRCAAQVPRRSHRCKRKKITKPM